MSGGALTVIVNRASFSYLQRNSFGHSGREDSLRQQQSFDSLTNPDLFGLHAMMKWRSDNLARRAINSREEICRRLPTSYDVYCMMS
jgi:hypothetical protein